MYVKDKSNVLNGSLHPHGACFDYKYNFGALVESFYDDHYSKSVCQKYTWDESITRMLKDINTRFWVVRVLRRRTLLDNGIQAFVSLDGLRRRNMFAA